MLSQVPKTEVPTWHKLPHLGHAADSEKSGGITRYMYVPSRFSSFQFPHHPPVDVLPGNAISCEENKKKGGNDETLPKQRIKNSNKNDQRKKVISMTPILGLHRFYSNKNGEIYKSAADDDDDDENMKTIIRSLFLLFVFLSSSFHKW